MNTVWHSLLWKEWHENRWKLASLTVILFAVPLCTSWGNPQEFPRMVFGISIWYSLLVPIYIAAGVCASEASGGTLSFLQATPVDRRLWALAKLAVGLFTVVTPLLLLHFYVVVHHAIDPYWLHTALYGDLSDFGAKDGSLDLLGLVHWALLRAILLPGSLFIWSLAAGVKCRRELWVIAYSMFGFMALWMIPFSILTYFDLQNILIEDSIWLPVFGLVPGGVLKLATSEASLTLLLIAIIGTHAGLLAWYLSQYGRSTRHAAHSPKAVVVRDPASIVIRKPRKSKTSAILWMQMQEIAPLAGICLALILLSMLFISFWEGELHGNTFTERLSNALAGTTGVLGFFFAILIGVGVFLRDLEPGLNTFWRSRPIPASQWFWTKFLSAYAMLMMSLAIPTLLASSLSSISPLEDMLLIAGLLTAAYTTAVAVTVLVRHAIYGCVLSMGIMTISFLITNVMFNDWGGDGEAFYVAMNVLQITLIAVTTLIAWLAVTRDWGWKR